ncbi:hypothetical protein LN650_28455 [Klebsiella pneumoniae subsp. pneumoniae]|nr:hypothetical protein [Klebsiella pneumoniae subsp. pneumoniae]
MDGSSGTPYQTVQPKDVLKTPKPPSGGFENGNVYRAACYAGQPPTAGVGNDNVSVHRGVSCHGRGWRRNQKSHTFPDVIYVIVFSVNNEAGKIYFLCDPINILEQQTMLHFFCEKAHATGL